jgi:hypothetical protein
MSSAQPMTALRGAARRTPPQAATRAPPCTPPCTPPRARPTGASAQPALLQRLRDALRHLRMDPRTAYLSESADHVDLERRMRAWSVHTHDRPLTWR